MNGLESSHTPREEKALELFHRHFAAFNTGDVAAGLSDFGPHSVVITPDGVFEGPERIRLVYEGLLAEFGAIDRGDSPGITLDSLYVKDNTVFIIWHAESRNLSFPFGTDTFVCNGDGFALQSISFAPPKTKRTEAA